MASKNVVATEVVEIKAPDYRTVVVTLEGTTPLITHAFSEKARRMMLEAQQREAKAKAPKEKRDPFADFMNALHWITEKPMDSTPEAFEKAINAGAKFGFPVSGIKEAALSAAYREGSIQNKVGVRGLFHIHSMNEDESSFYGLSEELAEILTPEPPVMREDMVRIGGVSKTTDLRYRPMFNRWKMRVRVMYDANGLLSLNSIVNMINKGGFMVGLGEWRTEKNGSGDYGMFRVVNVEG